MKNWAQPFGCAWKFLRLNGSGNATRCRLQLTILGRDWIGQKTALRHFCPYRRSAPNGGHGDIAGTRLSAQIAKHHAKPRAIRRAVDAMLCRHLISLGVPGKVSAPSAQIIRGCLREVLIDRTVSPAARAISVHSRRCLRISLILFKGQCSATIWMRAARQSG